MALESYTTGSGLRISAQLKRYGDAKVANALGTALYREGQGILSQSLPLVPVDTGALRASGYVTPPMRAGDRITVTIGSGGIAQGLTTGAMAGALFQAGPGQRSGLRDPSGYAIYVHENLEAHHTVGSAKYLEIPFRRAKTGMTARIAADMRGMLSAGLGWAVGAETAVTAQLNEAGNIIGFKG